MSPENLLVQISQVVNYNPPINFCVFSLDKTHPVAKLDDSYQTITVAQFCFTSKTKEEHCSFRSSCCNPIDHSLIKSIELVRLHLFGHH